MGCKAFCIILNFLDYLISETCGYKRPVSNRIQGLRKSLFEAQVFSNWFLLLEGMTALKTHRQKLKQNKTDLVEINFTINYYSLTAVRTFQPIM
jgi:hypothetical protein